MMASLMDGPDIIPWLYYLVEAIVKGGENTLTVVLHCETADGERRPSAEGMPCKSHGMRERLGQMDIAGVQDVVEKQYYTVSCGRPLRNKAPPTRAGKD
jgi:hypothetical protein